MTPAALRAALSDAGLTQREFAARSGVTYQAVQRWVQGQRPIPGWVPALLAAWEELRGRAQATCKES